MLLKFEMLTAQATQQVVERADDDVGFVLPRWRQARRKVQFPHQFNAADQGIVGTDRLSIEIPKITEHHHDETLRQIEQHRMTTERAI